MKKILSVACTLVFSMFMVMAYIGTTNAGQFCFLCGSGSSCQQCTSVSGKDTSKDRKICQERGCKVSGTGSCSTAANVKICR